MNSPKKPFYKRIWFYILGLVAVGVVSLFLIPYGPNGDSIGGQLFDTAEQFGEQYVYDEKEHWGEEEWNEYLDEHEEFVADSSGIDWERFPSGTGIDDPRLEELPPNYSKLWNIDFSNLETIERYDAFENKPVLDQEGNPVTEEFIYRDKTTGEYIVDLTLDGFILRLSPDYTVGWNHYSETDPNGFNKYKKAQNLELFKEIEGGRCWINISPHGWNTITNDEAIEHPEYEITMGYNAQLHSEEKPVRRLTLKLDEAPYNTDIYSIEMLSSPVECFDADLEMEIVNGMTFLPPELQNGPGPDYDELNAFPIPYYWPNPLDENIKITIDEVTGEQIVEYDGFRFRAKPGWRIESSGNDVNVVASRRCSASVGIWEDWQDRLEEDGVNNFSDYFQSKTEKSPEWGVDSIIFEGGEVKDFKYEAYENSGTILLDDGEKITHGGYAIKNELNVVSIYWTFENISEDVRRGECDYLGGYIFNNFEFI